MPNHGDTIIPASPFVEPIHKMQNLGAFEGQALFPLVCLLRCKKSFPCPSAIKRLDPMRLARRAKQVCCAKPGEKGRKSVVR